MTKNNYRQQRLLDIWGLVYRGVNKRGERYISPPCMKGKEMRKITVEYVAKEIALISGMFLLLDVLLARAVIPKHITYLAIIFLISGSVVMYKRQKEE
jgi:hypothetical protein